MDIVFAQSAADEGQAGIDAIYAYDSRIEELSDLLDNAEERTPELASVNTPEEFRLAPAFPNPFNPITTIGYQLPASVKVKVGIYDARGRQVALLANEEQPAGYYRVRWNAAGTANGLYFCRMEAPGFNRVSKLVLTK